jgi:RNA polymerase sigma-70 factor (ECF subfamily)
MPGQVAAESPDITVPVPLPVPSGEPGAASEVVLSSGPGNLGEWFGKYRGRLLAMIKRRLDPRMALRCDPDDILQDAFLRAQKAWDRYRQADTTPYAWLYGIALRCVQDEYRHQHRLHRDMRRDQPYPTDSSLLGSCLVQGDSMAGPSEAAARGELSQQVAALLDQLEENDREIIWMRFFDELTYKEIAQVLGISMGTVATRCSRAQRRLRELWEELFGK